MPEEEVLTVREVAKLLKVTPATIYAWSRSGRLPAFKIGQQWRIHKEELAKLMWHRGPTSETRSQRPLP